MKSESKKNLVALICLLSGIITGVWFFSVYRYQWIYKINGDYLTFTQPEMMQSMNKLFNFKPEKNVEQFIVFGGSSSLHSINDVDLSNKLTKQLNRPVQVILVGYDDQRLLDTYEMIDALPMVSSGYHVHIINTWSFWRLIPEHISKSLVRSFSDKIFYSKSGIRFLNKYEISPPNKFSTWEDFADKKNLYPQTDSFSKWLKYFFLDKLIKLNNHRYAYLFKDNSTDNPQYLDSPYYAQNILNFMRSKNEKEVRKKIVNNLYKGYDNSYNELSQADKKAWLNYNILLFTEINRLGRRKGYDVLTLELPIYKVSNKDKYIRKNLQLIHEAIASSKISYINANSQNKIENNTDVWWDLVHMNLVGMKIYETYLIKLFKRIIRND